MADKCWLLILFLVHNNEIVCVIYVQKDCEDNVITEINSLAETMSLYEVHEFLIAFLIRVSR